MNKNTPEGLCRILAKEIRVGDIWLGERTQLEVLELLNTNGYEKFVPWAEGRNTPPVLMQPVKIFGRLQRPGTRYTGEWILQPDMPIEVIRWEENGVD